MDRSENAGMTPKKINTIVIYQMKLRRVNIIIMEIMNWMDDAYQSRTKNCDGFRCILFELRVISAKNIHRNSLKNISY